MKKSFILAAASILALAACSKQTMDTTPDKEVAFQVAKYVNATKAEGDTKVKYDPSATFGTYAIFSNGKEAKDAFMSNVEIGLTGNTWAPVKNAYYWPKTGSLDFVSYSPFASSWISPVIEENAYTKLVAENVTPAHTFAEGKEYEVDLMYSDVALNCKSNSSTNLDADAETDYAAGVPTLFRHALSKLNFNAALTFNDVESGEGDDAIYTSWEVEIKSMTINNVIQNGSLTLDGYAAPAEATEAAMGVWNLPEGNIWTPGEEKAAIEIVKTAEGEEGALIPLDGCALLENYYVMPQAVSEGMNLSIAFVIRTYRYPKSLGAGNYTADNLFLTETASTDAILLANAVENDSDTKIASWQMSRNYTYNLRIAPAKTITPDDDTKPSVITMDPATADWTPVSGVIKLSL